MKPVPGNGAGFSFRRAYRVCFVERAVDLVLHIGLAVLLPGPWWFQFLPDLCVPVLLAHGMITDRMLPEDSRLLRVHVALHNPWVAVCFFLWMAVSFVAVMPEWVTDRFYFALIHYATHLTVDSTTHEKWRGGFSGRL